MHALKQPNIYSIVGLTASTIGVVGSLIVGDGGALIITFACLLYFLWSK